MKHLTYNPPFVIKIGEQKFRRKYTLRGSIRALPDVCLLLETLSMYVRSIEKETIVLKSLPTFLHQSFRNELHILKCRRR